MAKIIKVGSLIKYRGDFGTATPSVVSVTNIERSEYKRDKYGKPVNEVPFSEREYCVFVLDNGHWCYGEQIDDVIV